MFWQSAYAGTINLPQASNFAARVDSLHDFLWWLSVVSLGGTTIAMLYFVFKYHRSKKGRETAYILGSHVLEVTWTVIPLILMLAIFAWGYKDYLFMRMEYKDPVEVNVIGRQWLWNFEYPNGKKMTNELILPKGRPVKLIMTSEDVLHSFFMPHMRQKQDVVPGIYTYVSFIPTITGEHPVYCAEYCGTAHSDMLARLYVVEPEDYDRWVETGRVPALVTEAAKKTSAPGAAGVSAASGEKGLSLADKGRAVSAGKGCIACHSDDGSRRVGPTWKGVWGTEEELADGTKVKVDENYIRESIMEPNKKLVKGFPPSMPPFKGLLSDEEVNAIIAYIKSLK